MGSKEVEESGLALCWRNWSLGRAPGRPGRGLCPLPISSFLPSLYLVPFSPPGACHLPAVPLSPPAVSPSPFPSVSLSASVSLPYSPWILCCQGPSCILLSPFLSWLFPLPLISYFWKSKTFLVLGLLAESGLMLFVFHLKSRRPEKFPPFCLKKKNSLQKGGALGGSHRGSVVSESEP